MCVRQVAVVGARGEEEDGKGDSVVNNVAVQHGVMYDVSVGGQLCLLLC